MIRALSTAATGLEAQQSNIERVANDLANANTDGYKRSVTEFSDLMYQTHREAGAPTGAGSSTPVGIQTGMGVRVGATHKLFDQGPARVTNRPEDLMIEGRGFFQVQMPNGEMRYSRAGSFKRDVQGRLGLNNGGMLVPQITIPSNVAAPEIGPNGEVKVLMPQGEQVVIGQIQLAMFQNEDGLSAEGNNLYRATAATGAPLQNIPGENSLGTLLQGALEASNVNVAQSMVDMITTQRTYEMNTKVMGVADSMLGATSNIVK